MSVSSQTSEMTFDTAYWELIIIYIGMTNNFMTKNKNTSDQSASPRVSLKVETQSLD